MDHVSRFTFEPAASGRAGRRPGLGPAPAGAARGLAAQIGLGAEDHFQALQRQRIVFTPSAEIADPGREIRDRDELALEPVGEDDRFRLQRSDLAARAGVLRRIELGFVVHRQYFPPVEVEAASPLWMILTPALAPMRVAPAATIASASAWVRTPPAAFTPSFGPTTRRMSATSAAVAPPAAKPVEVFT